MNIDHTKDTLAGITGLTDKELADLAKKIANTISALHKEGKIDLSYFMEELQLNYSYDEIIILASQAMNTHYENSILYSFDKYNQGKED